MLSIPLQMTYFKKPPQIYGHGAANVTSPSLSISAKSLNGSVVKLKTKLKFQNRANAFYSKHVPTTIPGDPEKMTYFKYNLKNTNDATILYVKPDILDVADYNTFLELFASKNFDLYDIYAHSQTHPTTTNYEYKEELSVRNWEHPYGFKIFIKPGTLEGGNTFVALKPQQSKYANINGFLAIGFCPFKRYFTRLYYKNFQPFNEYPFHDNPKYFVFDVVNGMKQAKHGYQMGARYFNKNILCSSCIFTLMKCIQSNEIFNLWTKQTYVFYTFKFLIFGKQNMSFLIVSTLSDVNETVCLCSVAGLSTTFATTFYVPPNTIDFSKVFSKFDASNASVYGTVIALIVLYIVCLIWARRQDKKDIIRPLDLAGFLLNSILNWLYIVFLSKTFVSQQVVDDFNVHSFDFFKKIIYFLLILFILFSKYKYILSSTFCFGFFLCHF
ncbi:hypothetical protein KUTeg_003084 [Tegillarca granosa]|uniref:Uncharacterized protein n=1 Tax=Tegillarca granosa TaxID=220873 RepID=A0ABQ9FL40_TEGGR|nr:hypothetical protein KUTeg_003084 [Tegillarca granosa]